MPNQPGLINTTINRDDPLKSIKGYDPEKVDMDPKTDTVAGQVESIVNKDSPLMQTARTNAMRIMNKRGILNSTMAGQAGEQAVIESALPIAQQDADIYGRNKMFNAETGNRANEFTASQTNQAALQERSGQQQIELQDNSARIDTAMQKLIGEQETGLQNLRGEQARDIANIEANYRNILQASDSATTYFSNTADGITAILANADIPAQQKQQLIDKQVQLLESGLSVIGGISNLDLNALLDFS